jgi:hypothetical protein
MKSVKDMYKPEVVMFVHSNQHLLFKQESSLQEIKTMNDEHLYEVAYELENKLNKEQ